MAEDADSEEIFTASDVQNTAVAPDQTVESLLDRLLTVLDTEGYTVEIREPSVLEHGKKGTSAGGEIFIKERDNQADQFRTLVHEYAHEKLHQTEDGPVERPKEVVETEAEAIAYAVCLQFDPGLTGDGPADGDGHHLGGRSGRCGRLWLASSADIRWQQ